MMDPEKKRKQEARQKRIQFVRNAAEEVKKWNDEKKYMAYSQSNKKGDKSG